MVLEKKEFRVYDLELLYNQQLANQAVEGMDAFEIAAAAVEAGLVPVDVLLNAGLARGRGAKKGRKGGRGEVKPGRGGSGMQRPVRKLKK